MRARWQQQRMGRVPVSFNSSCVCMCGCVCVCVHRSRLVFVLLRAEFNSTSSFVWRGHESHPAVRKSFIRRAHSCFSFVLFFFVFVFFNWNQFLCTLQSQIIRCPSSFCLGIDWPRSSHSEKKRKKKEQSITHTRTHVLARLGKRSRDCSTHFRKAQGQKGEEAPCQVLQLHCCELGFGRAVGRGWSGLAHWSTVGNWWGL